MCGPLSVLYMTKVSPAIPRSSSALRTWPTFLSWSIIVSWYGLCQRPDWPMLSGLVWVRKCMWVKFTQTKNGLPALACRSMNSTARSATSSSIVSMRFLVRGPVSVQTCLPTLPKRGSTVGSSVSEALQSSTPRGPNLARNAGSFG